MSHAQITLPSTNVGPAPHCPSCTCTSHATPVALDTTPQDIHSSDEIISRLAEEIKRNTEILSKLKRERNARLPLARVPPEILAEIFLAFRSVSTPPSSEYSARICWADIIHVSAHWRAVALSDPRLWNTLDFRFPTFVDRFIQYIGALPLRVVVSSPRSSGDTFASWTLGRICTVENPITALELHSVDSNELSRCLDQLLPGCSGGLCSLEVGVLNEHNEDEADDDDGRIPLLTLWSRPLPVLHTLVLKGLSLTWDYAMFRSCSSSLRELVLIKCISLSDLAALASFVHLEKLELYDFDYESEDKSSSIPLPSLKIFRVEDIPHFCANMIENFTLNPQCCITIIATRGILFHRQGLEDLVRRVSSHSPIYLEIQIRKRSAKLQCIAVDRVHHTLEFLLSNVHDEMLHIVAGALSCSPESLSIFMLEDRNIMADTLSEFCMPVASSARTLTVGGDATMLDALAGCLAHHETFLPRLTHLDIVGSDFSELSSGAAQKWRDGVIARHAVLKRIDFPECIGTPPALPEGQEQA